MPQKLKKTKKRKVRHITAAEFIRRNILDISTHDLAKELGVAQSIVSRYEFFPVKHRLKINRMAKAKGVTIAPEWHEASLTL